jgi:broad specificity phosphatase PhoE
MKFYFVRHGESEANLLCEFSNRGFKHGLTERGFQQAEALGRKLGSLPITKIYTSPLMRAVQTAEILKKHLNCPLETTYALREFDTGILEGKSDSESWEKHTWVFNQWLSGNWEARIPGGESHLDLQARFIPFIESLCQDFSSQELLLVGHGGLFGAMLPLITTNLAFSSIEEIQIHNAMPIIIETRANGLFCSQWGERNL